MTPRPAPRLAVSVLLGLAMFALAGAAFAQRVVLVRPAGADSVLVEAFNRLRAELKLQDFEVVVVDANVALSSAESVALEAQRQDAFAGICFARRAGATSADVWIADRVTGKTSLRTFTLRRGSDAPSVLAVRAADFLRSSLRELEPGEEPAPEVTGVDRRPMPERVRAWARPRPDWRLRLEGTALGPSSGVGPAYGAGAALSRRISERFAVGIALVGPLLGATWSAPRGRVSLRQELGWLEVSARLWQSDPVTIGAAVGLGVYHLEARSEVDPPLVARSDQVTSALANAELGAEFQVASSVAVGAGVAALALGPRPGVAVAEDESLLALPLWRGFARLAVDF